MSTIVKFNTKFAALMLLMCGICNAQQITLSPEQAQQVGNRIWHNEGAGKVENLTVWNKAEAFPSFGIGHFIWYPKNVEEPFQESFPALIEFIGRSHKVPPWLLQSKDAPWRNREHFYQEINSPRTRELRALMQHTIALQVKFIVQRMAGALPKISAAVAADERHEITQRFYQVADSSNGVYALIDYVNFKGEGTNPKERYRGEGWGLLQVLQQMNPEIPDTMTAFATSADFVLTRRVINAPRDETRWLPGWRKRLQTYLKP